MLDRFVERPYPPALDTGKILLIPHANFRGLNFKVKYPAL
jgi:hypothetical protein